MDYRLSELVDVAKLQQMLDSLYASSKIPSAIIDNESNVLTASGWQDICTKFHRANPITEAQCRVSDTFILSHIHEMKPYVMYKCPHGLIDTATPIVIGGRHLANTFTGQLLLDEPDIDFFKAQAKKYGFDEQAYLEALAKVPRITKEQLENNLAFIAQFTEALGEMGLKRLKEKETAEQLRQAQKMEVVGRLAGGIAHDFNNILTAIIGCCTIAERKTPQCPEIKSALTQIDLLAQKAANLTRGLLAFSRKQAIQLRAVDVNGIVSNIQKILTRVIGEDIELKERLSEYPLVINADTSQIEQILLNLATNARDAMPDGGTLSIETSGIPLDTETARRYELKASHSYALITVSDTGTGMDKETIGKIFEPFFTTKELGRGTGLGLATVFGIVKQHGGQINVYSETGIGTTFRIYLPIADSPVSLQEEPIAGSRGGNETILLVEDDSAVRDVIKIILEEQGYRVLSAGDGEEAVSVFRDHQDDVHLVMLDVVMPKMNGQEASERIKAMRPKVKFLFTSGYTADIIGEKGIIKEGIAFISKPVRPGELLNKIRQVLTNDRSSNAL